MIWPFPPRPPVVDKVNQAVIYARIDRIADDLLALTSLMRQELDAYQRIRDQEGPRP